MPPPAAAGSSSRRERPVAARALTHVTAKWEWLARGAAGRHVLRLSYDDVPVDPVGTARRDAEVCSGRRSGVVDAAQVTWTRPAAARSRARRSWARRWPGPASPDRRPRRAHRGARSQRGAPGIRDRARDENGFMSDPSAAPRPRIPSDSATTRCGPCSAATRTTRPRRRPAAPAAAEVARIRRHRPRLLRRLGPARRRRPHDLAPRRRSPRRCSRRCAPCAAPSRSPRCCRSGTRWACTATPSSPRATCPRSCAARSPRRGSRSTRSCGRTSGTSSPTTSAARCSPTTAARAREHRQVLSNTVASFALGDYEWILALEAPELVDLVDLMRHLRADRGSPPRARGGPVLHRPPHRARRDRRGAVVTVRRRAMTTLRIGTRGSALALTQTGIVADDIADRDRRADRARDDHDRRRPLERAALARRRRGPVHRRAARCAARRRVRRDRPLAQGPPHRAAPRARHRGDPARAKTPATRSARATASRSHAPRGRARRHRLAAPHARSCAASAPTSRSSTSAATSTRGSAAWRDGRPGCRAPRRRGAPSASAAPTSSPSSSTSTAGRPPPARAPSRSRCARGDEDLVRALDHAETRAAAEAERHVLALLEAGCSAPLGAHAVVDAGLLLLSASVYSLDGTTVAHRIPRRGLARRRRARSMSRHRVARELLRRRRRRPDRSRP